MLMAAALALAAASAVGPCPVPPGAEALWQPSIRYLLIGEIHGTAETPAAFADLVCAAARSGRPVTVAVEYSSDDQPVVDAFLASNGDAKARAALLTLPIWHDTWQDGRSSTAFLALFERLRVLKQAGLIRGVVCSDVGKDKPQGIARDAIMARGSTRPRRIADRIGGQCSHDAQAGGAAGDDDPHGGFADATRRDDDGRCRL